MRILTPKHSALAGVIVAVACLLAGGVMLANGPARAGVLRQAPLSAAPMMANAADTIEVSVEWAYLDADRATVQYTLKGVSEEPRGNLRWTCPIRKTILVDSQDRKLGANGTQVQCLRSGPGTYRVIQDFFQHLPGTLDTETELSLRVVVDLDANVLTDGTVGGLNSVGSAPRSVLDDVDSSADRPQQTHLLKVPVTPHANLVITQPQLVERNGLKAELRRLEIMPAITRAVICMDLPDADDWHLDINLSQGGTQDFDYSSIVLNSDNPAMSADSHRCWRFTFPFAYQSGASSPPLLIHIPRLVVSPDESAWVESTVCERARQRLVDQASGIDIRCETSNKRTDFKIIKAPEGMSQEAAGRLVRDAYSRILEGPWEFTIPVQ
jgi:hypothetical protein